MLGDTYRLLRRLRKHHYLVERGEDNRHHVCWNIYHPDGTHDAATNVYTRHDKYVGTVQSFNPEPVKIRDAYLCFGRPTLFFNETYEKADAKKELQGIASYFSRVKFIPKRL